MACQTKLFPSDIATPMLALGAVVTLHGADGELEVPLSDFLGRAPDPRALVLRLRIPPLAEHARFCVFKVTALGVSASCPLGPPTPFATLLLGPNTAIKFVYDTYCVHTVCANTSRTHNRLQRNFLFPCRALY